MNKTAIKNFAVWAREKLIADIKYQAGMIGITDKGISMPLPQSTKDVKFFDVGTKDYVEISGKQILQRELLISAIKNKERSLSSYKEAFDSIIEEVAYTWFNRLIAIRFMEVNDYLPSGIRVLSSENSAKKEPDFVTTPFDTDLEFTKQEQDEIIQLKDENKLDELFKKLFIKQCNKLYEILPELFEKLDDYTELLLSISFTDEDGIIYRLTHDIDEDDFNVEKEGQVEIIGWMYQYYNSAPKAVVDSQVKKGIKVTKEKIPAKTQLFTPDWIVRYMVENSLGRMWVNGHEDSSLRNNWKYYIDEAKQDDDVEEQLKEIKKEYKAYTPETIKFIDPCMGSGHILVYAFDIFMQIYESYGYTQRDAAKLILEKNIFGCDIDKRAYQLSYFSLMMKARQYNRRILTQGIIPNIVYIRSSIDLSLESLNKLDDCKSIALRLTNACKDADELGSLLNVDFPKVDLFALENKLANLDGYKDSSDLLENLYVEELQTSLTPLINQVKILDQKYQIVVTNPPYMAVSDADVNLQRYVKAEYPDSKTDLFAVFIERCNEMLVDKGFQAMITMHSWMFLSSYEKLRNKLIHLDTVNMVHLGSRAFEEIGGEVVQTTGFVFRNTNIRDYNGIYCRLVEPNTQQGKEDMFLARENRFVTSKSNFEKIPGSPIAYWASNSLLKDFQNGVSLKTIATPKQGIATTDNNRFVRFWYEIKFNKIKFNMRNCEEAKSSQKKWFPLIKGGEYRKWYGNRDYIVNYENDGEEIKANVLKKYPYLKTPDFVVKNSTYYFSECISWSKVSSGIIALRYFEKGNIFSDAGMAIISNKDELFRLIGFINSCVAIALLGILSPTLNYEAGHIELLPILKESKYSISDISKNNILLSKSDWDSFETSWDFSLHPLLESEEKLYELVLQSVVDEVRVYLGEERFLEEFELHRESPARKIIPIQEKYLMYKNAANLIFYKLKKNEEEINRIFIDIYGLQKELTPDEDDSMVSVHRIFDDKSEIPESMKKGQYALTKEDVVKSFISYAVGCMFGRYNPFSSGLQFAGGDWDINKYDSRFLPDADNCILISDEKYFEDDIVGRFVEFVRTVYGDDTLEDNLAFIAEALGNKGKTSRDVIRNYFLNDFIKDHIKMYQKRPIYWMFDSGKQNGFKALCYMHRWNADTTGNMRVEYLHRMQRVYEKEIERMQEIIDEGKDNKSISNATKRKEKLQKQLKETKDYDVKVAHMALSRIDIDLDDGVKVNYEKVQTDREGNKQQILVNL